MVDPNIIPHDQLTIFARALPRLLLYPRSWIHRVVSYQELQETGALRVRVSVDFSIPTLDKGIYPSNTLIVPLGAFNTDPVERLDVRDEGGAALPLLTRSQVRQLGTAMIAHRALKVLARGAAPRPPKLRAGIPEKIAAHIRDELPLPLALPADADPIARLASARERHDANAQWEQIVGDSQAVRLSQLIVMSFPLLVAVPYDTPSRRVLKYAYEVHLRYGSRTPELLGGHDAPGAPHAYAPRHFSTSILVDQARTVHVTVGAPRGLVFCDSLALVTHRRTGVSVERAPGTPILRRAVKVDERRVVTVDVRDAAPGAHLVVATNLGLDPEGVARSAFLASLGTLAMLVGGVGLHLAKVRTDASSAVAIVVAIPGLIAASLLRPLDDPLTERFARRARDLVLLSAIFSFTAGASLALQFDPSWHAERFGVALTPRFVIWTVLALASIGVTLEMGWAWHVGPLANRPNLADLGYAMGRWSWLTATAVPALAAVIVVAAGEGSTLSGLFALDLATLAVVLPRICDELFRRVSGRLLGHGGKPSAS